MAGNCQTLRSAFTCLVRTAEVHKELANPKAPEFAVAHRPPIIKYGAA